MTIVVISMIREPWGGSEELWAAMAAQALKENIKVVHLSYKYNYVHPKLKSLIDRGLISYTRPSYVVRSNNPVKQFVDKGINFIRKRLNRSFDKILHQKPDVIIYNGTCYSIAEEKKLLKILKQLPARFYIIGHFNDEKARGGISEPQAALIRYAYQRSQLVMFTSGRSSETAERHLLTTISNKHLIKNPVNITFPKIIPYPPEDVLQFAIVGNLRVIHKGQNIVLDILSKRLWRNKNWHLNIYGAGEDETYLKELTDFYELNLNVTFYGKVENIEAIWEQNHILLMPSLMEGMPLALVEAMLCARTCVVTDVGGHTEWITDEKEGFIAEAATINAFGKAMEKAWEQKDQWKQMGKNAYDKAMRLYDPEPGKTLLNLIRNN
jgi:glycosyltransferase involved in cell wall biosynthesis